MSLPDTLTIIGWSLLALAALALTLRDWWHERRR